MAAARAIGGRPLVGLLIAMLVWTLAYACEAMVVGENAKIFFGTLGYPGAMSVPVFFFLFVVEYTQRRSGRRSRDGCCGSCRRSA